MRMWLNLLPTANIARRNPFSMDRSMRMEHDLSQF
jgi:hypothetical protein